jgi:hypothetical protein
MTYSPLIPAVELSALWLAVTAAVIAVPMYFAMMRHGSLYILGKAVNAGISLFVGAMIGSLVGITVYLFYALPTNAGTVERNVEQKYDVSVSDVYTTRGSTYAATITDNGNKSARNVEVLIASDGTPTIISADGFDPAQLQR